MKLQKIGGYASIIGVCAYFVAVLIYNSVGLPDDPVKAMETYQAAPFQSSMALLFITAAYIIYLVYFLALYECMHADAPYLTWVMLIAFSVAAAFGTLETVVFVSGMDQIAPTRDISAYRTLNAVFLGIHNAGCPAIGWACLLAGWAILKTRAFSSILGWLVVAAGITWLIEFVVPQLPLGAPATYLTFVSNILIGISLIRKKPVLSAVEEFAAAG